MRVLAVLLLAAALGAPACQPGAGPLRLLVDHPTALADAPLAIRVEGVPARAAVTVRAVAQDSIGRPLASSATFTAGTDGRVDLSRTAPRPGSSYAGVDGLGLIWSLLPEDEGPPTLPPVTGGAEVIRLSASAAGSAQATATIRRLRVASGVTRRDVTLTADGIVGRFYSLPVGAALHPAALVLGGSEGGLGNEAAAMLLAAHGFPALVIAYFGEPGLPPNLMDIPLEYFTRALAWLSRQPGVDQARLLVMGVSRGTEAALLLGADFPALVHAVAAYAPSSVVNPGLTPDRTPGVAWTLGGRPVPAVTPDQGRDPAPQWNPDAIIPVERIRGPILLVSGADDQLWPAPRYAAAIMTRLDAAHDPYPHTSLVYPDAGHGVVSAVPGLPTPGPIVESRYGTLPFGGSPAGNARAVEDSWPRFLKLLNELKRP
jgi:dienelactone hydrolase